MSCDLLPSTSPGPHIVGDVLMVLGGGYDLLIAHPPCTYLSNSGVRHLHSVPSRNGSLPKVHGEARWKAMKDGAALFVALRDSGIPKICIENPIPHRYAREIIGDYTQIVRPWMFGEQETKATCLWLKGLPTLKPTEITPEEAHRHFVHEMPPSKDRWKLRSLTSLGMAQAMAEQWG